MELAQMLARAAVTLMPVGWDEPFGLVAAEAQMVGCPVVGYRRGALPEVVEEGVSGLLVEPGDEAALVAALRRVGDLSRPERRESARRRLNADRMVAACEDALVGVARGAFVTTNA